MSLEDRLTVIDENRQIINEKFNENKNLVNRYIIVVQLFEKIFEM